MVRSRGRNQPRIPFLTFVKENTMHTADMLIHVHPDLNAQARTTLEKNLLSHIGVDCAEFEHKPQPHSILVRYDPETIAGMDILMEVRNVDPVATMVGM